MIVNECVHAYSAGYTSTAKDGAWHTLGMDTEIVDSGSYHDNATNNSRITFPSGGVFLVFASPQWADPHDNAYGQLIFNGAAPLGYNYGTDPQAALPTGLTGPVCFWVDDFSAGDYVESQALSSGGGSADARTQMAALEVSDWSCHVGTDGSASPSSASPQTFANTLYDPHGMVTSSTTLTVQQAGYYLALTVFDNVATSTIQKNGSDVNGSYANGAGVCDYAVDWFDAGDTVQMTCSGTMNSRQMAMVYLGDGSAALAYTYNSVDIYNTDPGFVTGILRTDSEWIDTGNGHPQGGYQYNVGPDYCITCGSFNMAAGYHFSLAKIATLGGTFAQNDGLYTVLNAGQLGNVFSTNRHNNAATFSTVAFSCFQASYGDTLTANWLASGTYTQRADTPYTNVFVTDPITRSQQIYRRLEVST